MKSGSVINWIVLHTGIENAVNNKNKALFLVDGIFINAAYFLTTGVLMSGYAIHLGANDFIASVINNSANYATILSLVSFLIFERLTRRKKVLITLNFVSRTLIFLVAFLPLVFESKGIILTFLLLFVICSEIIWSIYRVGWLVWMVQTVSENSRNSYIFFRMLLIRISSATAIFAGGFILDWFNKGYYGFLILFSASYILSISDLIILRGIDDIECIAPSEKTDRKLSFFEPLKSIKYRGFLIFIVSMFLIYTLSTCLTPVYILKYLKLEYRYVSYANLASIAAIIISNKLWSILDSKKGTNYVIGITNTLIAFELVLLSFLTSSTAFLYIISSGVAGAGMGGFIVAAMSYRYKIMPDEGRTLYEGWYFFAYGMGTLLAPFIGNMLLNLLTGLYGTTGDWNVFRLLYGVSVVLMLFLLVFRYFASKGRC